MNELKEKAYHLIGNRLFRKPRQLVKRLVVGYISRNGKEIVQFPKEFFDLFKKVQKGTEILMSAHQAFIVYCTAKAAKKIHGELLEVGVYKAGSAKLICEAKGNKNLYLFDTFSGLNDSCELDVQNDGLRFQKGDFLSDYDTVKNLLSKYPNVFVYKGVFPKSAEPVLNKKFCFAHIDVDTYASTRDALVFLYPRMTKGGSFLVHDYKTAQGVTKAVDEFFKDKPETVITVTNKQCLIVKA